MTFEEVVDQALVMLQRRGRVTYRMLQRHFQLDDAGLEDLKEELIYGQRVAVEEDGRVLVWMGEPTTATPSASVRVSAADDRQARAPLSYTPAHLVDKILTSRSALEGERKQVTVLFADLKGSMELLAERDPEEARQLLDPVLERLATGRHMVFHELVLTELSEACLLVGRVDEASALAARLLELSHTGHGYQAHACRLLGEVARRREPPDIDQAATHYRQALSLAEEVGMRPLQAHCHLGLGTLFATAGQAEPARAELSTALAMYQAMDMTFWLPETEAALAQVEGQ
jgi:tetratricopeptide (TPR) repeat protein